MKDPRRTMKTVLKLLVVFTILFAGVCLFLYSRRDRVVIATFGKDDIYDRHNYQVLNPFRDHKPETAAVAFLHVLRDDCARALADINDTPERTQDTCERERKYPLQTWHVQARKDEGRSAVLVRYGVKREVQEERGRIIKGPFWIWVSNTNGKWHVTGYETWY